MGSPQMIFKLTHLDLAHSSLWGLYGVSLYLPVRSLWDLNVSLWGALSAPPSPLSSPPANDSLWGLYGVSPYLLMGSLWGLYGLSMGSQGLSMGRSLCSPLSPLSPPPQ